MKTAKDALAWMEEIRGSTSGLWLFRGQRHAYETIRPSLARLDGQARVVMYNVCRRFHVVAAGVTGYQVAGAEDRLALLQHYVGLSPLIDLTGTPLVAVYFALSGSAVGDECVVYGLDTSLLHADDSLCRIVDHSFLVLPLADGGRQHRWLRQDGYAACPKGWPSMEAVVNFDLLRLSGIQEMKFQRRADDLG
jgi:FRG domain